MKKINWLKVVFVGCLSAWLVLIGVKSLAHLHFESGGYLGFALIYGALFAYIALLAQQPDKT